MWYDKYDPIIIYLFTEYKNNETLYYYYWKNITQYSMKYTHAFSVDCIRIYKQYIHTIILIQQRAIYIIQSCTNRVPHHSALRGMYIYIAQIYIYIL